MKVMNKIKGFYRILRFELPISAGVCVVMGQLLALGKFAAFNEILLGFFSIFLISASILVLNDYFDIETDKINAPDRTIPSGIISPKQALSYGILLQGLGLLFSYFLSLGTFFFAVVLSIVGFLYNSKFKKSGLLGNLMVCFSVGMTFIYGGMSVGLPFDKSIWFFAIIAALIDLGEEIAADSMDMQGDMIINSNSLAIKYGKVIAVRTSVYIFSIVIMLSAVPFILGWFSLPYLIPIMIMDASIGYSSVKIISSKKEEGRKYIRWIYLGATLGLLVFIAMKFFDI